MASDNEEGTPVDLFIYDLTNGLASLLSPAILGHQIGGVWHTSVCAFGREYFYGGHGVTSCAPGGTSLGAPHTVERMGSTYVPHQVFADYVHGLAATTYSGSAYDLLEHNCNHFSDEAVGFLCGARVPKHILEQHERALPDTARHALRALLDNLLPDAHPQAANGVRRVRQDSPDYLTLNTQIEEARAQSAQLEQRRSTLAEKVARKERKKEKKRKRLRDQGRLPDDAGDVDADADMAEAVEASPVAAPAPAESVAGPSAEALALDADERRREEQRKRDRDPPIVYKDIDGAHELELLRKELESVELSEEERQSVDELRQYLVDGEGSWVLGDEFLTFVGRVLHDSGGVGSACRVCALRCLAACALREDVSLLLHQDRRDHTLVNYAHNIDRLPIDEQIALTLFMCNLFENISSSEWLVYISEWEYNGQPMSNIRGTTKVAVHAALSEASELREYGTALLHNLACKEVKTVVFDEVCVELAMAVLQLLSTAPPEELLHRGVKALARLALHSSEVPQLIALIGPNPDTFRGTSPRVDEQIDLILKKVK